MERKQVGQLITVIKIVQAMLAEAIRDAAKTAEPEKRKRRRPDELADLRRAIIAERKTGSPVPELARKHGVTPSYVYGIVAGRKRAMKKR